MGGWWESWQRGDGGDSVVLKKRVWEACVRPVMEYGVEVWEPGRVLARKMESMFFKGEE